MSEARPKVADSAPFDQSGTQPLHRELGMAGSCRASLYIYNTEAEIDTFIEALQSNLAMFAGLAA